MISNLAKQLVREVQGESKLKIGKVVMHPKDGKVKIVGGSFWGEYGVSNFWEWRKIKVDGTLSRKICCGYGWM